jgi:hypothetical protein
LRHCRSLGYSPRPLLSALELQNLQSSEAQLGTVVIWLEDKGTTLEAICIFMAANWYWLGVRNVLNTYAGDCLWRLFQLSSPADTPVWLYGTNLLAVMLMLSSLCRSVFISLPWYSPDTSFFETDETHGGENKRFSSRLMMITS